ncbi:unnamed protein product [Symbiodinium pilosum]|uniref:Uncharacterized protein n=1 Tax=Symbiodinium pilosum TaxID=2952 RepID=A0A812JTK0_SYMPI|nr:unnamed protein product [Symbiodinium pilosum]
MAMARVAECEVCNEKVPLPARFEAPCSVSCGRICHLDCTRAYLQTQNVASFEDGATRLIDCPCGKGVYAPSCAVCGLSLLPPTPVLPTCPPPCGRVLAHKSCIATARIFGAQRDCQLCRKPWML